MGVVSSDRLAVRIVVEMLSIHSSYREFDSGFGTNAYAWSPEPDDSWDRNIVVGLYGNGADRERTIAKSDEARTQTSAVTWYFIMLIDED